MIMLESKQTMGLCSTCNNSPTCFHRARRGPALFCEMFNDYVDPSLNVALAGASTPSFAADAEDVSPYAGLCLNCEHRRSCSHPKPAGGIWHCENYE